jgi:hypothetical protein
VTDRLEIPDWKTPVGASFEPAPSPRPLLHLLSGARPSTLLRIVARHGGCSRRFYPHFAATLALSVIRAPFCALETVQVAERVAKVRFDPPPVIIIGHWRSGTTFLHNLMSRDSRFCFPTILDAARPYDFFPGPSELLSRKIILWNLPPTRPMDDVPLSASLPQEEEIALAAMGAPSFFNCFYFPRHIAEIFRREVLFDGLEEQDLLKWRRDFVYYVSKIAALQPGRRILLKNPANSVRLRELNALFPGARFIHIHRDPREVFVSTRRLFHQMIRIAGLQDHDPAQLDEHIYDSYPLFMDRLHAGLHEIDPARRAEVRYAELVLQPFETLERLYRDLDLGDFSPARPAVAKFLADSTVAPRSPRELDAALADRIGQRWRRQMLQLDYGSSKPAVLP